MYLSVIGGLGMLSPDLLVGVGSPDSSKFRVRTTYENQSVVDAPVSQWRSEPTGLA